MSRSSAAPRVGHPPPSLLAGKPGPAQDRGILVRDATGAHAAKLEVVDQPDRGELLLQDRQGNVLFRQP